MRRSACAALACLLACSNELPPERDCRVRVWSDPGVATHVVGSWDGWQGPGTPLEPHASGLSLARLELPVGQYGYELRGPLGTSLDAYNPLTTYHEDDEVSLALVEDCSQPKLLIDGLAAPNELVISGRFLMATDGDPLAPDTLASTPALAGSGDADSGSVSWTGTVPSRTRVSLAAADEAGRPAVAPTVIAWPSERHHDDEILYQVMIDRFRGDGGGYLEPPPTPGSRAGGTLDGVRAAIEDGSITRYGATAIWLSPVYLNPDEARLGSDGQLYEGYHGYWPVDSRAVDPRIGGEAALDALVATAHAHDLKVLLDVVPNHVYEDNPLYQEQAVDWFSAPGCICGTESCPWHLTIERCWFTPYLPDFRFQTPGVMDQVLGDVTYWLDRFDLDGLRIDAVPMMPRSVTRRIAHDIRSRYAPRRATLLLGEIFTGPDGLESLAYHLGPAGLDSVFDFPLMWALRGAIANDSGGFDQVDAVLAESEQRLAGSGAVLARIIDNHDTTRFISEAVGDAGGDPWLSPAAQPEDATPYRRTALALAITFTLPGIPVLYQGDEIGLAGASDPDNRRVMPATLSDPQAELAATVERLGALRRCSRALRHGDRQAVHVTKATYAYRRTLTDEADEALVVISAATAASDVPVALGGETWIDAMTGESFAGDSVALPALSFRVLLPAGHACLQ